jgi:hypothetical protein
MCLSVWVGFVLSLFFIHMGLLTPMVMYGSTDIMTSVFFDGLFSGGVVWLLHSFQEYLERGNQ